MSLDVKNMPESSLLGYEAELSFLLANPQDDTDVLETAREYSKVRRELNLIQLGYPTQAELQEELDYYQEQREALAYDQLSNYGAW